MKVLVSSFVLLISAGGCSTQPTTQSLAGMYSSNPVRQDSTEYKWANGVSHTITSDFTLSLLPNGRYIAGWTDYLDGQVIRFSGLAAYDLRTNSQGTWRFVKRHILLRSDGPSLLFTKAVLEQGQKAITPEDSEARVRYYKGEWTIDWLGQNYFYRGKVPNQSLEPMARSVTPSACAEVAPALAMAHH